jgi:ferritin-like metal-binding protein YciE
VPERIPGRQGDDVAERTIQEQLTKYLTDVHSIEEQALQQMRAAPKLAGDPGLADIFSEHLEETKIQERRVRDRLDAYDAAPTKVKDLAARAGGVAFVMFAGSQPDTPGKLVAHSYSYEHMELAAYELLMRVAERAGDQETVEVARVIATEERAMAGRLADRFGVAVEASLDDQDQESLTDALTSYLADAHAIESQAIQLLGRATDIAGDPSLASVYEEHLAESHEHQRRVEERLGAHDASASKAKDAAMRLGALNWGGFFGAQPDTPAKLAGFAFAFEHLEIAAYEELAAVARRAGDEATVAVAENNLAEERAAAQKLESSFDRAMAVSLEAQGVAG